MKLKLIPTLVLSLVLMPMVAVLVFVARGSYRVNDLKILGEVSPFELIERSGEVKSLDSLKGKVWVLNFFCTVCNQLAPLVALESQKISKALLFKENFRLVTVTLDPNTDSIDKINEFAKSWQSDPFKWWYLRGSPDEIEKLKSIGSQPSSQFFLIDHLGRIRGRYDLEAGQQMKQLLKDSKKLIKQAF